MCDSDELQAQLLNEYSKTIDTSTILAIISDYNLHDASQLVAARGTLDILKLNISEEEATGFDPSGAGGENGVSSDAPEEVTSRSGSGQSLPGWTSQTDDTSLSQEMLLLELEDVGTSTGGLRASKDGDGNSYTSELDVLDDQEKEKVLLSIFPILKLFDIQWALRKYKGDASLALDELMTQSFLAENGSRHKGIEAFSKSEFPSRLRKGKGKSKNRTRAKNGGTTSPSDESAPEESQWEKGRKDIEFIALRTSMQVQQVGSIYHKSGGSAKAAIAAIIEAHKAIRLEDDDPMIQINAYELLEEFPSIPSASLEALVQITHPILDNARDLAKVLTYHSAVKNPIQLDIRHPPISLSGPSSPTTPTIPFNKTFTHGLDNTSAENMASSYRTARNSAFIQASAYYRKGKSDHLMGGAAAYYAQEGRNFNVLAKQASSAAADALVAEQSSSNKLDLHGVSVKDAVRISREKVTQWWHELGESKLGTSGGVEAGYQIVTGKGTHSEGGKSRLGPAVGRMLVREGWKVEVLSGRLVVKGVVGVNGSRRR
ncbi:hypothetical protein BGZ60DRAFT_442498 [Tricladium varicosporioides]|nr:hypothetical protein BGZ60DRAFT_442498 [Hymenoscyphus varicosporioides]